MNKVPSIGKSFICIDDKINKQFLKNLIIKTIYTYGFDKKSNFNVSNIKQNKDYTEFI